MAAASYESPKKEYVSPQTMNRLVKDVVSLHKQPLTEQGIYYQHDSENMLLGYAMIIGPKDTPYEHGFYFFKFDFPYDYPVSPPKVTYMTNDGKTRFHPNLYRSGKTCLSILNTWKGEGWTSCQTIRSVLLTLVSILDETPLLNEPGVRETNPDVSEYTRLIKYRALYYAHLTMIDRYAIPAEFINFHPFIIQYCKENEEVIHEHFKNLKKNEKENCRVIIYNMDCTLDYDRLYDYMTEIYETLE